MWSQITNVTDGQTDRRTDDMRSQDRTLHYSALRGKKTMSDHACITSSVQQTMLKASENKALRFTSHEGCLRWHSADGLGQAVPPSRTRTTESLLCKLVTQLYFLNVKLPSPWNCAEAQKVNNSSLEDALNKPSLLQKE